MEEKKASHMCRESKAGCTCEGMFSDHWMSQTEYTIVRNLLLFMFILFVFWTGLTLGELRAYLKADNNFGYPIPASDSMMGSYANRNEYPPMMGRGTGASTAPSPTPWLYRK